jgi:hypothetical protein
LKFALPEAEGSLRGDESRCEPSGQGVDESATRKINLRIFPAQRKRGGKSDGILGADLNARSTLRAFGKTGSPWIFRHSSHGTGFLTFQTFIAIFVDSAFKKSERRDQAEKCSQGTEIAAPKPRDQKIKSDDPSKDQKRNPGHIIDRLKIVAVR